MRIYRYIMALFMLFALTTSSHAVSIKLDGTGGLTSGTDCQTGALYRFGTGTSYNGQQLDLLVKILDADNEYSYTGSYCTFVQDGTLATNLRDQDDEDDLAFQEYEITLVKKDTTTAIEVDRLMLTGYDLDTSRDGNTDTDDFYVAADGAYLTSGSAVTHSSGLFYGTYTDKMKGYDVTDCEDTAATPDVTCRGSSIWINGNGLNKVSTIKVRVQNDNAYGQYTGTGNIRRLIQLSFQIEDFGAIFSGLKEYGDAPSTYGEAGGELDGTIMLGSGLPADSDTSYLASNSADADDNNEQQDEAAVTLSGTTTLLKAQSFNANQTIDIDVTTYGSGYLQLWADWNGDGDFEDSGEHVVDSQHINNTGESVDGQTTNINASSGVTITPISFTIPSTVQSGDSFIRVRFSEGDSASEKDSRSDLSLRGEVEDYQVSFTNQGTVSGSVKDSSNNPLSNVIIKLMQGTGEVSSTVTDASGIYTFSNVPLGDYTIVETDKAGYTSISDTASIDDDNTPNTDTNDNKIPLTITSGEIDAENNFVDELKPGTISGNVKDTDNNNLSGIVINLMNGTTLIDTATTDANGSYTFTNVAVGEYNIVNTDTLATSIADADESEDSDTTSNGDFSDKSIPVTITAEETDADNNFVHTLPILTGTISGFVKDEANNPIAGANIELVLANGSPALDNDGNAFTRFTTLSDGAFSFTNIPQGDYMLLEVNANGYISVSDNAGDDQTLNSDTRDDFIPVTLTAGENDSDNIFIDKKASGSISGSVTDIQGNGLENIIVSIQDNAGNSVNDIDGNPLTTTTDVSGFYSFNNVPEGDYIIVESDKTGYISTSDTASVDNDNTPNTDTNDNKIPVTITDGENDIENNFVDEGVKSISGKVLLDIDGDEIEDKGIENVTVKLSSCDTNTFTDTTTDANGLFHFNNLLAGCYTITEIDPQGYTSVKDSDGENDNNITVTLSDSDVTNIYFLDEPSLNISGNVKADIDFDNTVDVALEDVTIELFSFDGTPVAITRTDVNGDYIFTQVTPGTYTIQETDPEGYSSLRDVDGDNENLIMITVSESDIIGRNFEDQKRITVSGVVKVDLDGDNNAETPLKNSTLIICKVGEVCTEDENIAKVITDEDGAYKFEDLEPGDYKIVEIDKEGYESIRDADGANDNTININLTGNETPDELNNKDFDNQAVAPRFVILTKNVAKKQASIGDFVPYSITVENVNDSYNYAALSIRDVLPAGFKYEKGSARLIRGTSKTAIDATGTNIVEFGSFNLNANEKVTLSYLLKVGVAVAKGEHINTATANQNGEDVSNTATASVTIIADPFIDNSVVIGKVFADNNGNGIQDEGESGIPGVRLATVTGMLIETDGYGRYHVADAESSGFGGRGSNFIVKVDKATLPEGASFTTENPRVLRITASGLNVIDFGVMLPKVEKLSKERIIKKTTIKKELVEVEKNIAIGSIFFDSDQDCIRPNQVKVLCEIAIKLREYQGGSIMIEGNTDARAPIWYNKKLAYKRAQSVYKELKQQLGDEMIGKVEVIYDNCESEVRFDPRYDWWGKPNAPKTKKECTQFGISKKHCNTLLNRSQGGAL